jgi:hypothetical protein
LNFIFEADFGNCSLDSPEQEFLLYLYSKAYQSLFAVFATHLAIFFFPNLLKMFACEKGNLIFQASFL